MMENEELVKVLRTEVEELQELLKTEILAHMKEGEMYQELLKLVSNPNLFFHFFHFFLNFILVFF